MDSHLESQSVEITKAKKKHSKDGLDSSGKSKSSSEAKELEQLDQSKSSSSSSDSSSSESESESGSQTAYRFRDTESTLQPVALEPEVVLEPPESIEASHKPSEQVFTETIVIEEPAIISESQKLVSPKSSRSSSSSSSSSDEETLQVDEKKISSEEKIDVVSEDHKSSIDKKSRSSKSSEKSIEKKSCKSNESDNEKLKYNPDVEVPLVNEISENLQEKNENEEKLAPVLHKKTVSSSSSSKSFGTAEDRIDFNFKSVDERIEIKEEPGTLTEFNPAEPFLESKASSSSSSSSSKSNEKLDTFPISTLVLPSEAKEQSKIKNHPFADISSIDIYGGSHFLNLNDKSDFSMEVSHNQIDLDEDMGRKSSIHKKEDNYSASEEETLQELQVLETAFSPDKEKLSSKSSKSSNSSKSSKFSMKEKPSELDQAVVIDNSEIHERDSSNSSGIDETEILKRIQTEPTELNEANYKDIELYENLNDPPVSKLAEDLEPITEQIRKLSSSSSSSKKSKSDSSSSKSKSDSSSSHEGSKKSRSSKVKESKECVVDEEITTEKETFKDKEKIDKHHHEGRNEKLDEQKNEVIIDHDQSSQHSKKENVASPKIEEMKRDVEPERKYSMSDSMQKELDKKGAKKDSSSNRSCSNCGIF